MASRKGRPPAGSSLHGVPSGTGGRTPAARTGAGTGRGASATPPFTRPALAPSLLAAIVLLACTAIVDSSAFVFARWGVTVLALIVLVFAVRGRAWWAAVLMAAVAVCWNPLVVVPIAGEVWAALQIVAAALFIVVGILVKVPRETTAPDPAGLTGPRTGVPTTGGAGPRLQTGGQSTRTPRGRPRGR